MIVVTLHFAVDLEIKATTFPLCIGSHCWSVNLIKCDTETCKQEE